MPTTNRSSSPVLQSAKRVAAVVLFVLCVGISFLIGIGTGYSLARDDNHDALLQRNRELMYYHQRFGTLGELDPAAARGLLP